MHIGTKIKIARITKGLNQEELAAKINKTRPLISHIEQTGKANIHTLRKICSVLNLDPEELQSGEAADPKSTYHKEEIALKAEIKRLKEENALLKELIASQKEIVNELREKLKRRRGKK